MQDRYIKPFAATVVLAVGLCSGGTASAQTSLQQELTTAAAHLGHGYDENYAKKDAESMADLYAADATLVSPSGTIVQGHDQLVDYYKKRFASGATGHHITIDNVTVLGDSGYSLADFHVMSPDKRHHLRQESGHIVAVYEHTTDGWRFKLVMPSTTPAKNG